MDPHLTANPPGWRYNPSNWLQRIPIVILALVGFAIAMYLSLYQWQVIDWVWEPFFGRGSHRILRESEISRLSSAYLGFPDAFLGALAYAGDAVTGLIGGRRRWRTMPWIVIIFGVLVGPLGLVSVFLVIAQPVLYQSWCTLCLASAVVSVLMIGPAMDELLASLQHLRRQKRAGVSVWRAFWGLDQREIEPAVKPKPRTSAYAILQGAVMLLGVWLMLAPTMLDYHGAARTNDYIVGPLIATLGCIAIWEITRPLRWINLLLGAWLLIGPWVLGYEAEVLVNSILVGLGVIVLSLPARDVKDSYGGGWWSLVARPQPTF